MRASSTQDLPMNFTEWEEFMLRSGYPKPFLKNIAVGSVVTLQTSLVRINKEETKEKKLAEAHELKFNSRKYGLDEMETLSDTLSEKISEDDEIRDVIKELAIHLKQYKEMVKENCT